MWQRREVAGGIRSDAAAPGVSASFILRGFSAGHKDGRLWRLRGVWRGIQRCIDVGRRDVECFRHFIGGEDTGVLEVFDQQFAVVVVAVQRPYGGVYFFFHCMFPFFPVMLVVCKSCMWFFRFFGGKVSQLARQVFEVDKLFSGVDLAVQQELADIAVVLGSGGGGGGVVWG